MLGFGWVYTQKEACVRFWLGLNTGKFVLGFGLAYTLREACVRFWASLYTEGSLC